MSNEPLTSGAWSVYDYEGAARAERRELVTGKRFGRRIGDRPYLRCLEWRKYHNPFRKACREYVALYNQQHPRHRLSLDNLSVYHMGQVASRMWPHGK